ncbi:hypothetical protein NliqN6_1363 [Naganishia liquefaciens]|uniref:Exonuclease domain-containing protein n=1 Tax=Naganishia liquefaciens TaxID=104408 RepID=A0A8H3TPH5_9TREE|nr:hypothetical protein NliqN6_1363 [Naganishia liquefaciens]
MQVVALDCEMVVVRRQPKPGVALARVSLVGEDGQLLYDSLVHVPSDTIIDYQTPKSGIREGDLEDAPSYENVRNKVIALTKGKILVGHALWNDLAVLNLSWNLDNVRDTALYYPLRKHVGIHQEGVYPSLKVLAEKILGKVIQVGEHSSIEDAQTCLALYALYAEEWDRGVKAYEEVTALLPNGSGEWYW